MHRFTLKGAIAMAALTALSACAVYEPEPPPPMVYAPPPGVVYAAPPPAYYYGGPYYAGPPVSLGFGIGGGRGYYGRRHW